MNPGDLKAQHPDPAGAMDAIESTAADWIARRNGRKLTPREQAELDAWLVADTRHAKAFAEMEAWWTAFNTARTTAQTAAARNGTSQVPRPGDAIPSSRLPGRGPLDRPFDGPRAPSRSGSEGAAAPRTSQRRRAAVFATMGLAAAAVVMLALFQVFAPKQLQTTDALDTASIAIRPDRQTLPDGSVAELNAGAQIEVVFTAERRGVRLIAGEALFEVAHDPARPFVVTAGTVEVRAVGTAFSVRYDNSAQVNVVVTQGRVAVEHTTAAAAPALSAPERPTVEPIFLDAGSRIAVPTKASSLATTPAVELMSPTRLAEALAWRERRMEFTDTPLADAVTVFNRQNRVQLLLAETSLKRRSITGVFWSDDPETFARLLETGFELKTERQGDRIVLHDGHRSR